jgi:hypothetical protein
MQILNKIMRNIDAQTKSTGPPRPRLVSH